MIAPVTHLDFETRSAVNLKKHGVYRYAEDASTSILCLSYRVGGGPVQRQGEGCFPTLARSAAHNAAFERLIWNAKSGAPPIRPEDQDCTMARANALNLPASLDAIGEALNTPIKKDKAGHALMMKMCKAGYLETREEFGRLQAYCDQDVLTECAVDQILPPLSPEEKALWVLDQTINDRGFAVDLLLVERAHGAVEAAKRMANKAMHELTDGAVEKASQTQRLVKWINAQGVPCESVAVGEHDEIVTRCDLFDAPHVMRALEIRQGSTKAFKFQAMLDTACRDGRIRGTLVYNGALSGRWTGRLMQPHNMKRVETEADEKTVEDALWILSQPMTADGHVAALDVLTGAPLDALSLCSRAMIVASPGKKLIGGDFSNIEGRINAWINGEHWKIRAFEDYDVGKGPDLYRLMASSILDKPVEHITKDDRQLWGKVPELACGYQGGVNAFHKMGANYGVRVEDKTAKRIVAGWRDANPCIAAGWKDLQQAAIDAVSCAGVIVSALGGRVQFRLSNGFLFCRLPSGRVIAYPGAIVERKSKIVVIDGEEVEFDNWGVSFWGTKNGWRKLDLYGGMQMAHVVSGVARDILAKAMHRLEAANYPIVLTVHDETLSEVDKAFGSAADYQRIMEIREPWFAEIPITAKAWEAERYIK